MANSWKELAIRFVISVYGWIIQPKNFKKTESLIIYSRAENVLGSGRFHHSAMVSDSKFNFSKVSTRCVPGIQF